MEQLTPEVSKLLEQALSLSVEEQEALANSLISNLDGGVNEGPAEEGVENAWAEEIKRRVDDIRSGKTKMIPYEEVRRRLAARLLEGRGTKSSQHFPLMP
jgi:putative addiction module component (TIGR02574 family)